MSVVQSVVADQYAGQLAAGRNLPFEVESNEPSAHTAIEQAEMEQQVARAVDSLTHAHRLALALSQAGLTHKQIAAVTHCSEKAARRRTEKARQHLRLILSRCGPPA